MNDLQRWLLGQLNRRNLSPRAASLRAGLDHAAISRYLSGATPSPENCRKLASFFGAQISYVLDLAGHIEPLPEMTPFLERVGHLTEELTEEQQETILEMIQNALRMQRQAGEEDQG